MSGTYLLLGGAGLVGFQVAYRVGLDLEPERLVVVSRTEASIERALTGLRDLLPDVEVHGEFGDVFLREDYAQRSRSDLLGDPQTREGVFADLLGPFDDAYERSQLVTLLRRYRPDVIVDAVNTATAISYQDVYTSTALAKRHVDEVQAGLEVDMDELAGSVETLILSQAVPQLIRHVRVLHRGMREVGTRLYLKVGTTGTGGMGLDIPFTHSEDRPSAQLMTKSAVAFAHTGLLFLLARTGGGPVVKEVKPAALIGYADIAHRPIQRKGVPVRRHRAVHEMLGDNLALRIESDGPIGDVSIPVVDTGENGVFTKGEFQAITALGLMEMVTPEEIAQLCVLEIKGASTGRDIVGSLDGSVLGPSYRGGVVRASALDVLGRLEEETGTHSVALGQLGPPELSKLLWEAELLRLGMGTVTAILAATPDEISDACARVLEDRPELVDTITSLGLPILARDGSSIRRGPYIRIPEVPGGSEVEVQPGDIDAWADKGWVDLRGSNSGRWRERFRLMREARLGRSQPGSAGITGAGYLPEELEIGTIAAWVITNEHGGSRIM